MDRRDYLCQATIGITALVAGCTGSSNDPSGNGDNDSQPSAGQGENSDANTESTESNWEMVGADAAGTRSQLTANSPTQSVTPVWSFNQASSLGLPVTANNSVYINAGYTSEDETGNDPGVYSLNARDGSVQWSYRTYPSASPSPAVSGTTLYVMSSHSPGIESNCSLRALNTTDGTERWVYNTGSYNYTPPIVWNDSVYQMVWDTLYALNAEDGTERWSVGFESIDDIPIPPSPVIADGTVYVEFDSTLYALDANTGDELWRREEVDSRPSVIDGTVFVYDDDTTLTALDIANGTRKWSYNTVETGTHPALTDSRVYVGAATGNFVALNAADGSEEWTFELGSETSYPVVTESTAYICSGSSVHAINAESGDEITTIDVGVNPARPVLADNTLYVTGEDEMVALREN